MRVRMPLILFSLLVTIALSHADNACRFEHTKGVIDLTSLGRTDGSAAFKDVSPGPSSNYKYSYNPCRSFSEGTACISVAACQVSNDQLYQFALGTQESAQWDSGAGLGSSPSVTYTKNEKTVQVSLVCARDQTNPEFEALGESPTNFYKFRLTHKCACWDGCSDLPPGPGTSTKGPSGGGGGIGGGAVFVIILLVVVFVYLVGFALYYRLAQQKTGAELIPHRTFWASLPGYAKDGGVYVYHRITGKGAANYASV